MTKKESFGAAVNYKCVKMPEISLSEMMNLRQCLPTMFFNFRESRTFHPTMSRFLLATIREIKIAGVTKRF